MSLYKVTKVMDIKTNTEMNEKKLRGMPAYVYTPSDAVIEAINLNEKVKISDIGSENIWEYQERFTVKRGYSVEFRSKIGEWWRTSAVNKVDILGNGKFYLTTNNSVYLIEEEKNIGEI